MSALPPPVLPLQPLLPLPPVMTLLDRVRRTLRRHDLAGPGTTVVAAVSGGSDSVALARLLYELAESAELRLSGLAHFNHRLRPEADRDEQLCAALAASLSVPLYADREDIAARARNERRSIEVAARTARHEFFERARRHFGADVVATGHTRDDQAETFLLRLVRGAGARGLAAMHPRRHAIIRPLIDCRRAELRRFLEATGIGYVHDATNDDVSIPRNRVRAELLPLLEARFNPDVVDALAAAADVAREEWRWLAQSAGARLEQLCRHEPGVWRLDAQALRVLPLALARMVVWQALTEAGSGRPIGFSHVEEVLDLVGRAEGAVDAPGQRVQRLGGEIVLTSGSVRRSSVLVPPFRYPLPVPGDASVVEAGVVVSAHLAPCPDAGALAGGGRRIDDRDDEAVMVQLAGTGPLAVRGWRPGDRFRPLGLAGRKKLQDYFVDRKVPRADRQRVPLVVDEFDRIVWVAGHAIGEEFRVSDPAQPVLVLRLKPLGGPA